MTVSLQHHPLSTTASGLCGILKPVGAGVAAVAAPTVATAAGLTLSANEGEGGGPATTLALLESPGGALLHPTLRSVKTINIGNGESNRTIQFQK